MKTTTLRYPATSRALVRVTAFDMATGEQIKINNNNFVNVLPSLQSVTATTLSVSSSGKVLYT